MKKDRNCGCGGNMAYPAMMPGMPMMNTPMMGAMPGMPMMNAPMMGNMPTNYSTNNSNLENQIQNLNNQINSLEQRVNSLETLVNQSVYSNNYNTSNYQMM